MVANPLVSDVSSVEYAKYGHLMDALVAAYLVRNLPCWWACRGQQSIELLGIHHSVNP